MHFSSFSSSNHTLLFVSTHARVADARRNPSGLDRFVAREGEEEVRRRKPASCREPQGAVRCELGGVDSFKQQRPGGVQAVEEMRNV
ncbi:hypothetical protein Scep_030706 [Stephania cephalantha]|uniref:Uncharacterized protein n=1 Tax=Stephania cephalantha TaxID=152367 RepID=A0AAP0E042_9MAGN